MTKDTKYLKLGKGGKFHRTNGQFAKKTEIKEFLDIKKPFTYRDFSPRQYERQLKSRKGKVKTDFDKAERKLGKFVKRQFAYYYLFKCQVRQYRVTVSGSRIESDKVKTVEHWVGLSSNSQNEDYIDSRIWTHHNNNWPNHNCQHAELLKVVEGETFT